MTSVLKWMLIAVMVSAVAACGGDDGDSRQEQCHTALVARALAQEDGDRQAARTFTNEARAVCDPAALEREGIDG